MLAGGSGIDRTEAWFSRSGDDLAIDLVGLSDRLTMAGWFTDDSRRVDQIRTRDGGSLAQRDVPQLVDAMGAFAPADALQVRQDPKALATRVPALAASWHAT